MIMIFTQVFKMAIKSIVSNKKRSFLTMLGIIIGVASVIALIGIASGATGSVTKQLEDIGTNLISVSISGRGGSNRKLSLGELQAFEKDNKDVIDAIIPSISGSVTAKFENENLSTSLEGTNEKYETVRNTKAAKGRFISALDVEQRQNVALIGTYVAKKLFPNGDGLGKEIKINGSVYYVIGMLEEKATSTARSTDDKVYIPYTSAVRLMKNANLNSFSIQAKSPETTDAVMARLEKFLFNIFKDEDSYSIFNQKEMLKTLDSATSMLTTMLAGIAGISLVVGGVGIMNIMLVSVSERTREIGVRKAIGAARGSIMAQFIIEAILISGLGGVIGIILGYVICMVAGTLLKISASPSTGTIMMAFGFSVSIGVFFGWSPANKASKLRPIEALRTE
jgi:putative ABC transport system permease protein